MAQKPLLVVSDQEKTLQCRDNNLQENSLYALTVKSLSLYIVLRYSVTSKCVTFEDELLVHNKAGSCGIVERENSTGRKNKYKCRQYMLILRLTQAVYQS